ncbi:NAD-dependent epimerase/dehydratase family protein [Oscillibacter sp.]|uniref:NAD-dependent epimerase/dehydratase family protein n=1 Tax=Oscillibacter sp. TaxID=1945593 RepID=UPI0028AFCF01|nr:NAD-dependent epimerase/dehydratase family protein [Oscillibacter sp.]
MSEKKSILVTGANGFIGHGLTLALRQKYHTDCILTPSSKELNLLDTAAVEAYFQAHHIDVVYHVAAKHAGVGSGISQPLYFLEVNLMMNFNIVAAARKSGVKKLITFGSSCTYQTGLSHPAREEDLWDQRAENTYGTCKQILLEHLQAQDAMSWAYFIPPNLYGPGDHFGETGTHFIPATVQKFQEAADKGQSQITVWGDGMQTRDFLYLKDVVEILLDAAETDRYDCRPINIATGRQVRIKEITELIRTNLGLSKINIVWDVEKPTGLQSREMDNTLFLQLNPAFRFTQIEDGIRATMDWYLQGADRGNVLC